MAAFPGGELPRSTSKYSPELLKNFSSRIVRNATAVDFDVNMSAVASCAGTSLHAEVQIDGQTVALSAPTSLQQAYKCVDVALSPNRTFVAVVYGTPGYSNPSFTAVFALAREGAEIKAQLLQWAPGAKSVDFSHDSTRVLFGSNQLEYSNRSGVRGNYLRASDLVSGTAVFHRLTRDPLKQHQTNPEVRAAYFTANESGAVVLLDQHSGIDYRWFDLDPKNGYASGQREYSTVRNSYRAAISPDRTQVVSAAEGGRLNIYSLKTGAKPTALGAYIPPPGGISYGDRASQGVAFSNSGRIVAVCRDTADAANLLLWSPVTGKTTGERVYKNSMCAGLNGRTFRFSPDDRNILVQTRAGELQWVATPGIVDPDFDRVAALVDSGDMGAIRRAFDSAKTPDSKKLIEALLVKKYIGKLLTVSHTTRGTDGKAFGGTGTGAMAEIVTAIAGYKVGAESTVEVSYQMRLDPKIFTVSNSYTFSGKAVLLAEGEGHYETNCMWPLPTKCRKPMNSLEFSEPVSGTLTRNDPTSGTVKITWTPKFESQTGGGLEKFFMAAKVNVRFDNLNIEIKE